VEIPDSRYAITPDGVYLAYQTTGQGPVDLLWQFDLLGNVDVFWEYPAYAPWFEGLSRFSRLILMDRRGTGLSSRNVPPPNLETQVTDVRVVLDAVGSVQPVLGGTFSSGAAMAMFAATDPERVRSLVWYAPSARAAWAPDYPWGDGPEIFASDQRALEHWGTIEYAGAVTETAALAGRTVRDEDARLAAKLSRHTATPDVARELARIWYETDIRALLPSVQVPALLMAFDAQPDEVEQLRYIGSLMPKAKIVVARGEERVENYGPLLDAVRDFVGVERTHAELDTVLSTVLFTDIVGSTEKQASLGDHSWKGLVERHHGVVREALERWRGVENDTAGDGFYATFDGPARAIRCALEVSERVRDLGIEVRAGIHTGECELIDGKCGGITVSIGARVAATAGSSEVRVSQTVKDLVAGSDISFEDRGEHELKGVPDRWHLYAVASERV
jgi:class 3 adenylate cyclase